MAGIDGVGRGGNLPRFTPRPKKPTTPRSSEFTMPPAPPPVTGKEGALGPPTQGQMSNWPPKADPSSPLASGALVPLQTQRPERTALDDALEAMIESARAARRRHQVQPVMETGLSGDGPRHQNSQGEGAKDQQETEANERVSIADHRILRTHLDQMNALELNPQATVEQAAQRVLEHQINMARVNHAL